MQEVKTVLQRLREHDPEASPNARALQQTSSNLPTIAIQSSDDGHEVLPIALAMGGRPLCADVDETGQLIDDEADDALREMCARLSASYKFNYFEADSLQFRAAQDILRRAANKKWTKEELLIRVDRMTESCKFPTWTPADFFDTPREQLYPRSWMLAEMKKDPKATTRMQFYKIDGRVWYRYTPPDGSVLPFQLLSTRFDDVYTIPERNQEKKAEEPKPKTMSDWYRESEQQRMQLELRFSQLEQEYKRVSRELVKAQETIDELRNEIYLLTETEPDFFNDNQENISGKIEE